MIQSVPHGQNQVLLYIFFLFEKQLLKYMSQYERKDSQLQFHDDFKYVYTGRYNQASESFRS